MLRNTTFNHAFVNQTKLRKVESKNQSSRAVTVALAVGGLFFMLLGVFQWVVFTVSGGNNQLLNRAGTGSVIASFIFFGFVAHFMDKSDEDKRRHKRERNDKFNRR